jgi:hypothetical protein
MTAFTSTRRRCSRAITGLATITILVFAVEAWGQASTAGEWRRGTTLAGFGGAATASGTTPSLGTSIGWEITPHLTVEGRGLWMPHDPGSTDFFAWLGAVLPIRPGRAVGPFASAGVGMYQATVNSADGVPKFYERRMADRQRATFEDFALAFGGGANIFLTSHIAIRPQIDLLLVTTQDDTRPIAVYGVHLAYHFEPHKTQ